VTSKKKSECIVLNLLEAFIYTYANLCWTWKCWFAWLDGRVRGVTWRALSTHKIHRCPYKCRNKDNFRGVYTHLYLHEVNLLVTIRTDINIIYDKHMSSLHTIQKLFFIYVYILLDRHYKYNLPINEKRTGPLILEGN
jgi:hypothetical protein